MEERSFWANSQWFIRVQKVPLWGELGGDVGWRINGCSHNNRFKSKRCLSKLNMFRMPFFWISSSRANPPKGFTFLTGPQPRPSVVRGWGSGSWRGTDGGIVGEHSGYLHGWSTIRGCPGQHQGGDRQPKLLQLWGWEGAANTFQKMSGHCLPGSGPNQLPMALKKISAN